MANLNGSLGVKLKIVKGTTSDFENYEVFYTKQEPRASWRGGVFKFWLMSNYGDVETRAVAVLEVDDVTGQIIRQVMSDDGNPVFTNGAEEIVIDNTAKLLLLVPNVREAFFQHGFAPKLIATYEKGVRIINKNPTVAIAVNVRESIESASDQEAEYA